MTNEMGAMYSSRFCEVSVSAGFVSRMPCSTLLIPRMTVAVRAATRPTKRKEGSAPATGDAPRAQAAAARGGGGCQRGHARARARTRALACALTGGEHDSQYHRRQRKVCAALLGGAREGVRDTCGPCGRRRADRLVERHGDVFETGVSRHDAQGEDGRERRHASQVVSRGYALQRHHLHADDRRVAQERAARLCFRARVRLRVHVCCGRWREDGHGLGTRQEAT